MLFFIVFPAFSTSKKPLEAGRNGSCLILLLGVSSLLAITTKNMEMSARNINKPGKEWEY